MHFLILLLCGLVSGYINVFRHNTKYAHLFLPKEIYIKNLSKLRHKIVSSYLVYIFTFASIITRILKESLKLFDNI